MVYSAETNPCQYAASTLQSFGLQEKDLVKVFSISLWKKTARSSKFQKIDE